MEIYERNFISREEKDKYLEPKISPESLIEKIKIDEERTIREMLGNAPIVGCSYLI